MFFWLFICLIIEITLATPYVIFLTDESYQGDFTFPVAQAACEQKALANGLNGPDISPVLPTNPDCGNGLCLVYRNYSRLVVGLTGVVLGTLGQFTCSPDEFEGECPLYQNSIAVTLGDPGCDLFWGFQIKKGDGAGEIMFPDDEFFGIEAAGEYNCAGYTDISQPEGGAGWCGATRADWIYGWTLCDSTLPILCIYTDEITGNATRFPTVSPIIPTSSEPSQTPSRSPSLTPTSSEPSKTPSQSPSLTPSTSQPSKSPSQSPSISPSTSKPSITPSKNPSMGPSTAPITSFPSKNPSLGTTSKTPTKLPVTETPTQKPTSNVVLVPSSAILSKSKLIINFLIYVVLFL